MVCHFSFKKSQIVAPLTKIVALFEKKCGALFGAFRHEKGRFLIQNIWTHCSSSSVDVKSQKTLKLIIIQKENQRFDIWERNMQEMESTCIFKSSRILRGECGIESFYFFFIWSQRPKMTGNEAQWKRKSLLMSMARLPWKGRPLLRLVVRFLAQECVVIQPIFGTLLLHASKNCKIQRID